jgi:tripartite-type tricarboxylate transporter receptor subunit TctC
MCRVQPIKITIHERIIKGDSMKRRAFIHSLAGASLATVFSSLGAQTPDGKAVQIIVPFAPGGSGDITARLLGQYMSARSGQAVVVENKPGANGIIGVESAKGAQPDGQTLLLATTSTHAANPSLFKKLPYDPEKDFSLVGVFGYGGSYMLVKPDAPYKTLAEFVAVAKARPGALNYGHFNASSNVPGALMHTYAGVELTEVPYKQIGAAITDLMAGRIQVLFVDTTAGDSYVSSGRLRALVVTRPTRLPKYPDLPTMSETYPGFDVTGFLGIAVPAATPTPARQYLNRIINEAIMAEPMQSKLTSFGFSPKQMSLEECAEFARSERSKWSRYITAAKIEPQ